MWVGKDDGGEAMPASQQAQWLSPGSVSKSPFRKQRLDVVRGPGWGKGDSKGQPGITFITFRAFPYPVEHLPLDSP